MTQVGIHGELAKVGPPATGARLRTLAGHTDGVSGMAFSPTGGCWPAAAGRDGPAVDLTLVGKQLTGLGQRMRMGLQNSTDLAVRWRMVHRTPGSIHSA